MKKVYTKDWMSLQPYSLSDEVDIYYVKTANNIVPMLQELVQSNGFSENSTRSIAIYLTAWFQDIVSETGIWKIFTNECTKRYGYPVPFMSSQKGNEYYEGEINLDDIRFLLWHYCQCIKRCSGNILNPEDPTLEKITYQIYDYLFDEYETAPANKRLYDIFYNATTGEEDFYTFEELLEWFHFCSYIGFENHAEYQILTQEIYRAHPYRDLNLNLHLYNLKQRVIQESRNNLLAWNTLEWLSHIGRNLHEPTTWADYLFYPRSLFLYEEEDESCLLVTDLFKPDKGQLRICKASLDMESLKALQKGKTIIECSLIFYGNAWWKSGTLTTSDYDEQAKQLITNQLEAQKQPERAYKAFMEASGNKQFVFCSTYEEMEEFLTHKMNYTVEDDIKIPNQQNASGFLLMASPHTGIHVNMTFCDCIASPNNTLYDPQQAKQKAIQLILNPYTIPYDLSCVLQDQGMLPDAYLNSTKGEEYGYEQAKKYGPFLTDYFFRQCREKDL